MRSDKAVAVRISTNKEQIIERLSQLPIVQVSCEKAGIGRATYYRWRNDDTKFAKLADIALREGRQLINDIAESQLLSAIKDQNMTAIIFWLKYNHPAYTTRVEITSKTKDTDEKLTPEQKAALKKALILGSLLKTKRQKNEKKKKKEWKSTI